MGLFIAERIRKREFGKRIPRVDKEALLDGMRTQLAQPIAGRGLLEGPGMDVRLRVSTHPRHRVGNDEFFLMEGGVGPN